MLEVNKTTLKMCDLSLINACVLLISLIRYGHLVHHCIDVTFEAVTVKRSLLTLFQIM
jgi:hypothetical protein